MVCEDAENSGMVEVGVGTTLSPCREWLSVLSKEIFNPGFGLFLYTCQNTLYINPDSHINPVGWLVG